MRTGEEDLCDMAVPVEGLVPPGGGFCGWKGARPLRPCQARPSHLSSQRLDTRQGSRSISFRHRSHSAPSPPLPPHWSSSMLFLVGREGWEDPR